MAGLSSNLTNANAGVWYVIKQGTKSDNYVLSYGNTSGVVRTRAAVASGGSNPDRLNRVAQIAQNALKTGYGNCGEKAAIAFLYLKRVGVYPLDYMSVTNGDHIFVLVGRPTDSDSTQVSTWGGVAAICDPWDGHAYQATATAIISTLPGALFPNYRSLVRWHPADEARDFDGPQDA